MDGGGGGGGCRKRRRARNKSERAPAAGDATRARLHLNGYFRSRSSITQFHHQRRRKHREHQDWRRADPPNFQRNATRGDCSNYDSSGARAPKEQQLGRRRRTSRGERKSQQSAGLFTYKCICRSLICLSRRRRQFPGGEREQSTRAVQPFVRRPTGDESSPLGAAAASAGRCLPLVRSFSCHSLCQPSFSLCFNIRPLLVSPTSGRADGRTGGQSSARTIAAGEANHDDEQISGANIISSGPAKAAAAAEWTPISRRRRRRRRLRTR